MVYGKLWYLLYQVWEPLAKNVKGIMKEFANYWHIVVIHFYDFSVFGNKFEANWQ